MAEGFEEIEALATVDILRRAGLAVRTVCCWEEGGVPVLGAHGIPVVADADLTDILDDAAVMAPAVREDVMIFPGGMPGAANLAENDPLMDAMEQHWKEGGTVAAICAAPGVVLSKLDGISGKAFTCYTGFEEPLLRKEAVYDGGPAVVDGRFITGRGPGCAVEFALSIVKYLCGDEVEGKVRSGLLLPY